MTERVLPGIAVPAPRRAGAEGAARPRPTIAAHPIDTTRPREVVLTMPARAGMLIGASAAIYAITLAGVAALQASSDAAIIANRQPYLDALAETRATNDALEGALVAADAEARALADDYASVGTSVVEYQARLDSLAALVAEVEGSAASLPSRIALPSVATRGAIPRASSGGGTKAPSSSTKSGASGG
jgi:hypothetical protein